MKIILFILILLNFNTLQANSQKQLLYTIKHYNLEKNNKVSKTTFFKTRSESKLLEFLLLSKPLVILYPCNAEYDLTSHLIEKIPYIAFPKDGSLKNFDKILSQEKKSLLFILCQSNDDEENKSLKRYQRWITKFYKKHPDKSVLLLKLKTQKKTHVKPLHVFNWIPNFLLGPKDYSFCITATESRSSSLEHAFSHL